MPECSYLANEIYTRAHARTHTHKTHAKKKRTQAHKFALNAKYLMGESAGLDRWCAALRCDGDVDDDGDGDDANASARTAPSLTADQCAHLHAATNTTTTTLCTTHTRTHTQAFCARTRKVNASRLYPGNYLCA